MAKYIEIKGHSIQSVATDPEPYAGAWSSGGSLNAERSNAGGAGIGASIVGAQLSKNTIITGGSPAFLGLYGSTNQLYANDVSGNYIGEGDWGNGVMGFNLVYNT